MGAFLPVDALPGLKSYKYASEDHSLASKYVLGPFYRVAVNALPKFIAPNLVTLTGLLFSVFSVVRAWWYNSQGVLAPPSAFAWYAFELFMYQTLDALDGLQARRTGASSPLGELFDHCVDAVNTSLQTYVFCSVLQYPPALFVVAQFACCLNFFASTWEEFHTKKLYLSACSGPVEGVLLITGLYIWTAVKGPEVWDSSVLGTTPRGILTAFAPFMLSYNIYSALNNVRTLDPRQFAARLQGWTPFLVTWAALGAWAVLAWPAVNSAYFVAFYTQSSVLTALIIGRVITAHVTHMPFPMYTPAILVPVVGVVVHLVHPQSDITALVLGAGLLLGIYSTFVAEIISEITQYLGIHCLRIGRREQARKEQ